MRLLKIKPDDLKKHFYVLFQVVIANEVPLTILLAYTPIPRHICKDVLISWIIASQLRTVLQQLVTSNFAKNRENGKREISLTAIIPFAIIVVVLFLHDVPNKVS